MELIFLLTNPFIAVLHGFIPEGVRFRIADPNTWVFIGLTVTVTCLLAGLSATWYLQGRLT